MKNNKFISISFIKFLITGFINTFSSFGLYVLLLKLNCNYIIAIILSYIFGIILSYLLNTFFVFKAKKEVRNMIKFIFSYLSSLIINILVTILLVNYLKIDKIIAQLIATIICIGYNFILQSKWVFK
ncbi:GtrA family protein [Leptotrichia sp. oral taxon 879]|uniref:GtrA family protein n=1 Tax=Leptotrichia mesophila TaxID=3239303 RepID=A0AB39VA40_9FUSO|nr:GtrA family protein [Leptotrichia sp. oral taxon 879]ERK52099.1 GtrA-like protein [Leptotrichia sp. oral taxon 879 str. F0557]